MMQVSKKEADTIEKALENWQQQGLLDAVQSDTLKNSLQVQKMDFNAIAYYAFLAAVSCALLAFGALVLDEKWIERMRRFFEFAEMSIALIFSGLGILFIWIAKRRKKKRTNSILANESFNVLILLSFGIAITYFAKSAASDFHQYGYAIFILALVYGITAQWLSSKLLWIGALLTLIVAYATQTYAWSQEPKLSYFLGMNYPLRMTLFGMVLIALCWLLRSRLWFQPFYRISIYGSVVFFLLSALATSVSGNLDYAIWSLVKQKELMIWSIGFTVFICGALFFAIKVRDERLLDIVIVFFLLNIYTRFFEYFWDNTNKGIFFAVLALSFWLIGSRIEKTRNNLLT